MLKTIYVGNLPFNVSEERIRNLFSREGIRFVYTMPRGKEF